MRQSFVDPGSMQHIDWCHVNLIIGKVKDEFKLDGTHLSLNYVTPL